MLAAETIIGSSSPGRLDLDDAGDPDPRVLGADDVEPGEARLRARPEVDRLRALDQPARLEIHPPPPVLQRQLDAVADQRLARQQRVGRRVVGEPEGVDQPHPRGVAPDQHRRPRHRARVDPRR